MKREMVGNRREDVENPCYQRRGQREEEVVDVRSKLEGDDGAGGAAEQEERTQQIASVIENLTFAEARTQ